MAGVPNSSQQLFGSMAFHEALFTNAIMKFERLLAGNPIQLFSAFSQPSSFGYPE
jgi:hypothetical protein